MCACVAYPRVTLYGNIFIILGFPTPIRQWKLLEPGRPNCIRIQYNRIGCRERERETKRLWCKKGPGHTNARQWQTPTKHLFEIALFIFWFWDAAAGNFSWFNVCKLFCFVFVFFFLCCFCVLKVLSRNSKVALNCWICYFSLVLGIAIRACWLASPTLPEWWWYGGVCNVSEYLYAADYSKCCAVLFLFVVAASLACSFCHYALHYFVFYFIFMMHGVIDFRGFINPPHTHTEQRHYFLL